MEDLEKAVAVLAERVVALEVSKSGANINSSPGKTSNGEAAALLSDTLCDLKKLRSELVVASKEIESRAQEQERLAAENSKLRYRIKHLLRTVSSDE